MNKPLNIFYEEPDPDRWFKFDRYPRRLIRRIIRGKKLPGGQTLVALNLLKGLDRLNIPYRFNDYRYIGQHPDEIACIIGKSQVLTQRQWQNPIIFGASVYSHPLEYTGLLEKHPTIKKVLVPGKWMRDMFYPYYGEKVIAWPVGIDTEHWHPPMKENSSKIDFLIYDKIRWEHDEYDRDLIQPIKDILKEKGLKYDLIQYGRYKPEQLRQKLNQANAAIFLCEHETQGLAYQQILSSGLPILAWERGGYWVDPAFYPAKVRYQPVSAVPYWDDRCGAKFTELSEFNAVLEKFLAKQSHGYHQPRSFILDNLTLEKCALAYVKIFEEVADHLSNSPNPIKLI